MKSLADFALDKLDLVDFKSLKMTDKLLYLNDRPTVKNAIFSSRANVKKYIISETGMLALLLDTRLDVEPAQLETFILRYIDGVCYARVPGHLEELNELKLSKTPNPNLRRVVTIQCLMPDEGSRMAICCWTITLQHLIQHIMMVGDVDKFYLPGFWKQEADRVIVSKGLFLHSLKTLRSHVVEFMAEFKKARLLVQETGVNDAIIEIEVDGFDGLNTAINKQFDAGKFDLTTRGKSYLITLIKTDDDEANALPVLKMECYVATGVA